MTITNSKIGATAFSDRILFVGFGDQLEIDESKALWDVEAAKAVQTLSEALYECDHKDFDIIVVDIENIEEYGPKAIEALRMSACRSNRTAISATSKIQFAELDAQLERAGAIVAR